MKDLNARQKTIKILEENTGSKLLDISCCNLFLDMSPKLRETKLKINYWDYINKQNKQTNKHNFCKTNHQTKSPKLKGNLLNGRGFL